MEILRGAMVFYNLHLMLIAGVLSCTAPALSCDQIPNFNTLNANSGELADAEWIPCFRDPNRNKLKQCSEEYRLCRESGKDAVWCLAKNYQVLTPAKIPSKDEYTACLASRHDMATCKDLLKPKMRK